MTPGGDTKSMPRLGLSISFWPSTRNVIPGPPEIGAWNGKPCEIVDPRTSPGNTEGSKVKVPLNWDPEATPIVGFAASMVPAYWYDIGAAQAGVTGPSTSHRAIALSKPATGRSVPSMDMPSSLGHRGQCVSEHHRASSRNTQA